MKQLKAAIIGCGKIGSGYDKGLGDPNVYSHAKAYLLNPHVDLVAVCDQDPLKLEQFAITWGSCIERFERMEALLSRFGDIDLLSLCTPTPAHEANLLRILETNIPYILCEKPLVQNYNTARRITDLYKRDGKSLIVNHVLRWDPGIQTIRSYLSTGLLGPLQTATAVYAKGLFHNGSHIVDLAVHLFGEPKHMVKLSEFEELPDDPTASFVFFYPGFQIVFLGLQESCYSAFEYALYFEKGKILITDLTNSILFYKVVAHPFLDGYRFLSSESEPIPSQQHKNMALVINDVVDGILFKKPALFRCTAEDACHILSYLIKIRDLTCQNL